jgi:hypothetical protein
MVGVRMPDGIAAGGFGIQGSDSSGTCWASLAERIGFAHRAKMNKLLRKANPADVASIDAIIAAAYDGISGPAAEKRDWNRERSLYFPDARLIPTAKAGGDVDLAPQILDIDGFIARVEPYFEESGFYEKEIARRTEQFGRLAQVWSTYESRHDPADPEPFMRGINSIQLFNDGNRWWIVNIYWQQENDEDPIPEKYLRNEE